MLTQEDRLLTTQGDELVSFKLSVFGNNYCNNQGNFEMPQINHLDFSSLIKKNPFEEDIKRSDIKKNTISIILQPSSDSCLEEIFSFAHKDDQTKENQGDQAVQNNVKKASKKVKNTKTFPKGILKKGEKRRY
jgi:hypothetical protein